jgi:hypothetical protein
VNRTDRAEAAVAPEANLGLDPITRLAELRRSMRSPPNPATDKPDKPDRLSIAPGACRECRVSRQGFDAGAALLGDSIAALPAPDTAVGASCASGEQSTSRLVDYYCSRPRAERLAMHRRWVELRQQQPDRSRDECFLQAASEHLAQHPAEPPFVRAAHSIASNVCR